MRADFDRGSLYCDNSLNVYDLWQPPICIVSDGPYGVNGFDGDSSSYKDLKDLYAPHIEAWSRKATSQTTLWFWCTEVGWAMVHPTLESNGWIYKGCNIWDKGIKHIAGNCNGKTMRKFPVVTEVCAHYTRKEEFVLKPGEKISLQEWMREEWKRTGLPFSEANKACGVKNAASRKYFAKDHLWYFPPKEEFFKLVEYSNLMGEESGRPYFSLDRKDVISDNQWNKIRTKFNFEYGVTNVWQCPPLRSYERAKLGQRVIHPNQKPLELMDRVILASTDPGDLVWEPFAGLASASVSASSLGRKFVACEIKCDYFDQAVDRLTPT